MISLNTIERWEEYKNSFKEALPFKHVVIDNFFHEEVAYDLSNELNDLSQNGIELNTDEHQFQNNKFFLSDLSLMPSLTQLVCRYSISNDMLSFISAITGIPYLQSDPTFSGGGIHISKNGGRLGMHEDFNELELEDKILYRRINLLIYLHKEWDSSWGGNLILQKDDVIEKIEPLFNRAVIFDTVNTLHGNPERLNIPYDNYTRNSLAFYYYDGTIPTDIKKTAKWYN